MLWHTWMPSVLEGGNVPSKCLKIVYESCNPVPRISQLISKLHIRVKKVRSRLKLELLHCSAMICEIHCVTTWKVIILKLNARSELYLFNKIKSTLRPFASISLRQHSLWSHKIWYSFHFEMSPSPRRLNTFQEFQCFQTFVKRRLSMTGDH